MELNDYQEKAMATCMESSNNFSYMFLNLVGEIGEFASKVAKYIRKERATINNNCLNSTYSELWGDEKEMEALKAELGDCLWQLSGLCKVMGWSLDEVAQSNIDKLASRKERNVIDGNGDNR